ncbi:MAG: FCD domain-containing protein, partial [Ruminococcus sp.]
ALPMAFARREQLDIPELKNLLDQIQCGSILDNIRADEASHMWLMAASGNHLMECVMQAIWEICSTQVNLILSGGTESIRQKLAAVHTQLYKSFAVGDLEMGMNAIDLHYQIIEQVLEERKLV